MKNALILFLVTLAACNDGQSQNTPNLTQLSLAAALPVNFAMLLFPGFQPVDVIGPMDVFNALGNQTKIHCFFIAEAAEAVSFGAHHLKWFTRANPVSFSEGAYVPTYNFRNAPPIDVLLIPGGIGTRAPAPLLNSTIDYVRELYPSLKYLFTVCTGSGIAARAGVLDGKHATTNKLAWAQTIAHGPRVKWVAEARWVQDGNVWTSSGVMAGIDAALGFVTEVFSEAATVKVANGLEYIRHTNSTDDPFAALYGLTNEKNSTHPVLE
ncbi:related to ThiJ/PfpI family protein [Rhynchosporium graminicola]|uniref:Related to ThiJ/PfpI family protein n=1 Tax=Rhynchosporium graminicola TaxID=2792576 RepID=A0A1E1KPK8_9HELO|nr:related to ThiJ/PfpI family protein [Rhynchosporium commune]